VPTQSEIERVVGAVPGVTSAKVDLVKPGVIRVRVVGGKPDDVRQVVELVKSVGSGVVIEHYPDVDSAMVEMFV
jgi:copper chaperone CopZ